MARDPDSMETTTAQTESARGTALPAGEFAEGPSRAERQAPRTPRRLPLWPFLVLIVIGAIAAYLTL